MDQAQKQLIRRRLRGRRLVTPVGDGFAFGPWAVAKRGAPAGFRHTSLAAIQEKHVSSRLLQDRIEEDYRVKIRQASAGARRDFMIRDYELWKANGRPTYGNIRHKAGEPRRTYQDGKPICDDFAGMLADERHKRIQKLIAAGD
jgi:hypothetical protein